MTTYPKKSDILKIPCNPGGNIYDIASQHEDKNINVKKWKYIVLLPDYYNCRVKKSKSLYNACKYARHMQNLGYQGITIIDCANGEVLEVNLDAILYDY